MCADVCKYYRFQTKGQQRDEVTNIIYPSFVHKDLIIYDYLFKKILKFVLVQF